MKKMLPRTCIVFYVVIICLIAVLNLSAAGFSAGDTVCFQSITNNKYVAAQGDLDSVDLRASALRQDSRTHFVLFETEVDAFKIKACSNNRYLILEKNGDIVAKELEITKASIFEIVNGENDIVSIQEVSSGKIVSVMPSVFKETISTDKASGRSFLSSNNNETIRPILPPHTSRGYTSEPPVVGKLQAIKNHIGNNEKFIIKKIESFNESFRAPENSQVLAFFAQEKGKRTVAGLHNREPNSDPTKQEKVMFSKTGKYAGLWSGDFLFTQNDIDNRQAMITEAINQWKKGALINIMWHASPPTGGVASYWTGGVQSRLDDNQWSDLVTDGGYLNGVWKERLDNIAYFLQQLEDEGVEVLFRPFHEMNQSAFWWAGRTGPNGTPKLYQLTHDYLEDVKGLTNLVWVWNVQDFDWWTHADYYVGDDYCDVASLDVYSNAGFPYSNYQSMYDIIGDRKPIAIGESNKILSPSKISEQPNWCFFMTWAELTFSDNNDDEIKATYYAENVITLDEMPGWDEIVIDTGVNIAEGKPVEVTSTEAGDNIAANLVDGNNSTRWSSEYADQQNIIIDLEAFFTVDKVILRWEAAYAKEYQIQVSNDNETWTTVYEDYNGNGGKDVIAIPNVSARYLKIYNITRAGEYGFSLWEVAAYGVEDAVGKGLNIKCDKKAMTVNFNAGKLNLNTGVNENSKISVLRADGRKVFSHVSNKRNIIIPEESLGGKGILFVIIENRFGKQINKIINVK